VPGGCFGEVPAGPLTFPPSGLHAFIDFVMLAEAGMRVTPSDFPPVGSVIEAVAIDFMPWGELRLQRLNSWGL